MKKAINIPIFRLKQTILCKNNYLTIYLSICLSIFQSSIHLSIFLCIILHGLRKYNVYSAIKTLTFWRLFFDTIPGKKPEIGDNRKTKRHVANCLRKYISSVCLVALIQIRILSDCLKFRHFLLRIFRGF